jgi:hypothetical protein
MSFVFQQYSAQLIQYKFDSFGGFKLDKVLEEIKRGKFLVRLNKLFSIPFKGSCAPFVITFVSVICLHYTIYSEMTGEVIKQTWYISLEFVNLMPIQNLAWPPKANNVTSSVEIQSSLFSRNHLVV